MVVNIKECLLVTSPEYCFRKIVGFGETPLQCLPFLAYIMPQIC